MATEEFKKALLLTIILLGPLYMGLYVIKNFPLYDLFIGVWATFWFLVIIWSDIDKTKELEEVTNK